jgi:hypothetical protein
MVRFSFPCDVIRVYYSHAGARLLWLFWVTLPVRGRNKHVAVMLPRHHSSSDGIIISSRYRNRMNAVLRIDFAAFFQR